MPSLNDKLSLAICKRMNALMVPENPETMQAAAMFLDAKGKLTLLVKRHKDGRITVVLIPKTGKDPIANAPQS